ncbi:MAG: DoxX family membrane protein [Acidobacteriota bacterium]
MHLKLTGVQQFLLVVLRFTIGWHLFYQGWGKLQAAFWSSQAYLAAARGPLAPLFQWLAGKPDLLRVADVITMWGLVIFGLLLMLGLFTRLAAIGGFALLLMFYLAMPPLPQSGFTVLTPEGWELYVNKTLIEALALLALAVLPTGLMAGLDVWIHNWRKRSTL